MRKSLIQKIAIYVFAMVLCFQSAEPIWAAEPVAENLTETESFAETSGKTGWRKPIDISCEGIQNAMMSNEEFMETFGVGQDDIDCAEAEMCEAMGVVVQEEDVVSANSVSVNSVIATPEKATYATLEDAADYMREKMIKRKETITIRIAYKKDTALADLNTVLAKVFEYDINGDPSAGDYLFWHIGGYGLKEDVEYHSDGTATVCFGFIYYTDWSEEKFVTREINKIIQNRNLKSSALNDYQKIRLIYDEIMNRVEYDNWHYEMDQSYIYMYTTYAALDSGYAVCQAYATLFYRLCEEVGISARVICGNDDASGSPTHGWNIVKIGNVYYNLDATWDDTISTTPQHYFFLKNMTDFIEHQRNARHTGAAFDKAFPTAAVSYPIPDDRTSSGAVSYGTVSGMSVKQTRNDQVKVTWNSYAGANRYMIYRKMGSGAYCCLGSTTGTQFKDEVKAKTSYTYQVYAINGTGEIAKSAEKTIRTKTMLPKKGKTYTVDGYKYKVLKSTSKTKTVAFKGVSKSVKKVIIPDKVEIHGISYKVTEIASGALKNDKKVKTVSIGANVTKIGSKAFYKAKKLANIVVKTKKLKSVGKNALSGISGKAEIRVPSSKLSKYKKLFEGKGQKSSVKIKK